MSFRNTTAGLGYHNVLSDASIIKDKESLKVKDIDALYTNGLIKKIIDIIPSRSLKHPIICDQVVLEFLEKLQLKSKLLEGLKIARKYGCCLAVLVFEGQNLQKELKKPLETDGLFGSRDLIDVKFFPPSLTSISLFDEDVNSARYLQPLEYKIYKNVIRLNRYSGYISETNTREEIYRVHHTRAFKLISGVHSQTSTNDIWFSGEISSYDLALNIDKNTSNRYDTLVLNNVLTQLKAYMLVQEASNLSALYKNKQILTVDDQDFSLEERQHSMNVLDNLKRSWSNQNILSLDGSMTYQQLNTNISDYSSILTDARIDLAAAADLTVTELWVIPSSGLNSNSETDEDRNVSVVESYRNNFIRPFIDFIFEAIKGCNYFKEESKKRKVDITWEWRFHDLKILSEKEKVEIREKVVKTYDTMIKWGDINPRYIFEKLSENDEPINYIKFDKEEYKKYEEEYEKEQAEIEKQEQELLKESNQNELSEESNDSLTNEYKEEEKSEDNEDDKSKTDSLVNKIKKLFSQK